MSRSSWADFKASLYQTVTESAKALEKESWKLNEWAKGAEAGLTTKKRDSWNKRFYLAMVDARTMAHCAPRDVASLRIITDMGGAASMAFISVEDNFKSKEIHVDGIRALWVWPSTFEDPLDAPTKLLYLHGGAFCLGSPESHKQLAVQLQKKCSCAVLLPDFRRCPEHRIGDARSDVLIVYRWLTQQVPSCDVVVGGESAGANLALGLALDIRKGWKPEAGRVILSTSLRGDATATETSAGRNGYGSVPAVCCLPMPAGLLLMSPWTDLVDSILQDKPSWKENEDLDFVLPDLAKLFVRWVLLVEKTQQGVDVAELQAGGYLKQAKELSQEELVQIAASPDVSPGLAHSFKGLPRTLVTIGDGETLKDSQRELVDRLRRDQVPVDMEVYSEMPHAVALANFMCTDTCKAPGLIVDRAADFVASCSISNAKSSA